MTTATSAIGELLAAVGRSGIELAQGSTGALRYRPPNLPLHLVTMLSTHKTEILAALVDGCAPESAAAEYLLGERLGIADDLGMPTHPGAPAWLIALGEAMNLDAQTCARSQAGA